MGRLTQHEIDQFEHVRLAEEYAESNYEGPFVIFTERAELAWLFAHLFRDVKLNHLQEIKT